MRRVSFLGFGLLAGCGGKDATLPAEVPYEIEIAFVDKNSGQFVRDHPARDATVLENGAPLGPILEDRNRDVIRFKRSSKELPSTWGKLEVTLQTPCGEKRIPITLMTAPKDKDERRWLASSISLGHGTAGMTAKAPSSAVTGAQRIRIEWGTGKDPLTIGTLAVKPGTSTVVLHDVTCQPDAQLRMGEATFGTLAYGSDAFILAEAGTCFSVQTVGYGAAGGAPKVVKAPYYDSRTLEFFLTPPTDHVQVAKGQTTTYRVSVQSATCPAPEPAK